ncbi:MAG: HAD-IIIC family phosphatase, partial [Patescibacteria group bacterium]
IFFFNFMPSRQASEAHVQDMNAVLADLEKNEERIVIFDFVKFLDRIGTSNHWYTKYKELGDLRLAPAAFVPLSEELMRYAVARAGSTKKCLILDLDNTLWRGIIGEDGMAGIVPDRAVQEYIVALHEKGIILAVNSKNNAEDAREVFEHHPDMILKEHHIAVWRANWQGKERNMAEIAEELNLGTDGFVFIDDSKFEQERVKTVFPEIAILSSDLLTNFAGFYSFNITEEDMRRGAMYVEERKRKEFHGSLPSEDEFLSELGLSLVIRKCLEHDIVRVSKLTQKTNQFNVATRRYTPEEIRSRMQDDGWNIWVAEAKDRFGDYGIIGIAMVERLQDSARIDNFLLSCRILGRKVEEVFLHTIMDSACKDGVSRIIGEFIPTKKNILCESFFSDHGFGLVSSGENQYIYHWTPEGNSYMYPHFIEVMLTKL